jgi:hypothetical protein
MKGWQEGTLGRPRKPASPDPRVERRRETYRLSKARAYERSKHERGRCSRNEKGFCPLDVPTKRPGPKPKPDPRPAIPKRVTVTLDDGRRAWYERP